MTTEKYWSEIATLKKFFELYCHNKHKNQQKYTKKLNYKDTSDEVELNLCDDCKNLLDYSFDRLYECPHDIKPRCRTCPTPCYEKQQWKEVAKLMRYSGIQLGLLKFKSLFKK
jgi:hypothetical protein